MIITVGGGKGGTGKSFVATNLAYVLSKRGYKILLVDADVESPVDHLLLRIERKLEKKVTSFLPRIIADKCARCNICVESCPEHALVGTKGKVPILLKDICDGCYVCKLVCPFDAIDSNHRELGAIYSGSNYGVDLIQGEAFPGVKQTVNIVNSLLRFVDSAGLLRMYDHVVIDSAPGTGALLWLTIRMANVVVGVTEPTPLGVSDLSRFLDLVRSLGKNVFIVINKADLEGARKREIYALAGQSNIFEIPYRESILRSYLEGKPIYDSNKEITKIFESIADALLET